MEGAIKWYNSVRKPNGGLDVDCRDVVPKPGIEMTGKELLDALPKR